MEKIYTADKIDLQPVLSTSAVTTFVKPNYSTDYELIDTGIAITRGSQQGPYNPLYQSGWSITLTNMEWNRDGWETLSNLDARTYTSDFVALFGGNIGNKIVGAELIMHDTLNDKYYKFKFTQWSSGGSGGGFTYERELVTFTHKYMYADGVVAPGGSSDFVFKTDGTRGLVSRLAKGTIINPFQLDNQGSLPILKLYTGSYTAGLDITAIGSASGIIVNSDSGAAIVTYSMNGAGLDASSYNGNGISAASTNGVGVFASSSNSRAGYFYNYGSGQYAPTLELINYASASSSNYSLLIGNGGSTYHLALNTNGNLILGTNTDSSLGRLQVSGTGYFSTSVRTPILYDANNTAYYVDPASTSVLNALTVGGSSVVTNNGGTWGINISGSASTSTSANRIIFNDGPRNLSDRLPNTSARTVFWDFVSASTVSGTGNYAGVMSFSPWLGTTASTGDSSYQLAFLNESGQDGSGLPGLKIRKGIDTTWGSWYTLLHSGNYTSYSPSLTGTGASGTWGINISGNAATATSANNIDGVAFSNSGAGANINADSLNSNGINYYTAGVSNFSGNATDGALYSQVYSDSWQHQIAGDYRSGQIALRGKNNGTWQSWRTVLDSSNYTSYSPALNGTGATGTWGISISGNALSAAAWQTARTLTIGNTGKSVNGTANVSWSLAEIGAYAATNPNGYTSNTGTVTSVSGTGGYGGLTLSGSVTTSGNLTLGGTPTGTWPISISGSAASASSATAATYSTYLSTNYIGGTQSNPQTYFNNGIGLKVAMTGQAGTWSDTLWINGYSGGDVPSMCALHFQRNGNPQMYISTQSHSATSYGTLYEIISSYNIGSQSVNYASSAGSVAWGNVSGKPSLLTENTWINSKYFGSDGAIYGTVFYDATNSAYYFDGNNTGDSIRVAGDIVAYYSDERLKNRIRNIDDAINKVKSLNGFYYEPNEIAQDLGYEKRLEIGVSAQEVEAILPEIIKDAPIGHGYKTLNYGKLTPLLIEAIKEQQIQIENQQSQIDELKQLVNQLLKK